MYHLNNINKIRIFLILYASLLFGFYFGENSSGGAYADFQMRMGLIDHFNNNFKETFLNYHNFSDRHSPLLIIIISFFNSLGIPIDFIRLIHLNFIPLLILISYKCLILKFAKINKNLLFIISCVFFLSASLRSIAIWPDSRLIGLLLFLCSVYFFLKFQISCNYKDTIYSNLLLILSAYFSPNFAIFFIYFFFYYLKFYNFSRRTIILLLLNFILSLPMFFYVFVLDVNFFAIKAVNIGTIESLNISNKIFIISSLIFFYLFPFIANKSLLKLIINEFKINHFYFLIIIYFLLLFFFNYSDVYTGGGIFFRISNLIFGNSYFFFIITFISLLVIISLFKININNTLLFFILIISNPQLTIYHKYYDPLLILLFFLFFDFKFCKEEFLNKNYLINIYVFYIFLLAINLGRYFI